MTAPFGLHWFRRDLRIAGNPALHWSLKRHRGRVLGIFSFDPKFLTRPDFSHDRFAFFLSTLQSLRDEMRESGGDLLVLDRGPDESFEFIFSELARKGSLIPESVSFNRDYEPFARARDARVRSMLERKFGITVGTESDHLLIEPEELTKEGGAGFYQVYSPFARRWFELLRNPTVSARIDAQASGLNGLEKRSQHGERFEALFSIRWSDLLDVASLDRLAVFRAENQLSVRVPIPEAGSREAYRQLRAFSSKIDDYGDTRDFPGLEGTSRFSIFFKNGSLTVAQVIAELGLQRLSFKSETGRTKFLKELAWREFYYHILYHCPRVEHESFNPKLKDLKWENDEAHFEAWKSGRTGFPIVDAAMRQLNATGWMHNRLRMIVASFLTKDLLIDWKWGERYFMQRLLDGDLAPNNGGWQWAASTGCDPQPYFRIFNPELQSKKFDPDGEFLRQWIPELRMLSPKKIHSPPQDALIGGYPAQVVHHSSRRIKALTLYSAG